MSIDTMRQFLNRPYVWIYRQQNLIDRIGTDINSTPVWSGRSIVWLTSARPSVDSHLRCPSLDHTFIWLRCRWGIANNYPWGAQRGRMRNARTECSPHGADIPITRIIHSMHLICNMQLCVQLPTKQTLMKASTDLQVCFRRLVMESLRIPVTFCQSFPIVLCIYRHFQVL